MQEQELPNQISLLPEYSKILQAIIELDENLQKRSYQNEEKCVNDVFSVIEKAYWTLYLEENADNLSEQQKKQIHFYLTSKIGKSLDSELSKSNLQSSKVPKWFLYKGYGKKQQRQQEYRRNKENSHGYSGDDPSSKSEWSLKYQNSLKTEERQGSTVDPYHANIKLEAENGLPQIEVIYRFFSIKSMLKNSTDMMDVQKITIINRKGNSYDREDQNEVQRQKEKFRQKFRLYSQLIRCFEHYGYGARIVKKHSKEKITGVIYQYAVVHISKITFKLLEKYVMNFINKKTRYTHRARLEKITYNMFNLPNFFTPELKVNFIKLIKIVFEVEDPLPVITKDQLQELYQYLIKQIIEKEKNPDKFKNQYMIKLENPTFYNVKKQLRDQVKQQAQERKRLGIRNKGRKSKAAQELNELKISLAEERQFFEGRMKVTKLQPTLSSKKSEHIHRKKKHSKVKKQEYMSQDEYNDDDLSDEQMQQLDLNDSQDELSEEYYDSEQQSEEIRDYFRRSNMSRQNSSKKKSKKNKKKKDRSKSKSKEKQKKDYKPEIYSDYSD